MTGSALSTGWWSGWIRCSWSAFTSSAAVRAIASSPRSLVVAGRVSPAEVAVRDRDGAVLRPAIPVRPRPRAPAAHERHRRRAAVEIVTLLAIEGRENFGRVDPVHLAAYRAAPVDQPGVWPEIEQPAAHASLRDERRAAREHRMQRVSPHQRAVRKQQRWRARARGGAAARAGARTGDREPVRDPWLLRVASGAWPTDLSRATSASVVEDGLPVPRPCGPRS